MSNEFYHKGYCLTKRQEEVLAPLLPAPKEKGRPSLNPLRVFSAILWILSSGSPWRDLPPHFGNWNNIYHKFRQWCAQNVFENILKALVSDTDKYLLVQIDSTYCKVHRHAAGAHKILGNQAIGVSRGGKNTKIHALVNENFQLIGLLLSGGQVHDSTCAIELLSKINLEGKTVLADKAFSSEHICDFIELSKATVCIPDKDNSIIKHDFDNTLYKARNIVERFFSYR
ncbi:MAG: IS5 family transposase [Selenomonadaceae bacterium]|nr:IS5 family transposase [Selenomonadaceae bacterium]